MRNADALLASELAMSTYRAVGHALKDDFRTRRLRVRCSVRFFSLNCCQIMLAHAGTCRLVRSPVSAGALRIPGGAGPYRSIRATMEQPWGRIGLDHYRRVPLGMAGRGYTPSSAKV